MIFKWFKKQQEKKNNRGGMAEKKESIKAKQDAAEQVFQTFDRRSGTDRRHHDGEQMEHHSPVPAV